MSVESTVRAVLWLTFLAEHNILEVQLPPYSMHQHCPLLYCLAILHNMTRLHCVCSFIDEHLSRFPFWAWWWMMLLWIFTRKLCVWMASVPPSGLYRGENRWVQGQLLGNCQTTFPELLLHLTFPPAMHRDSNFSSPSILGIICLLDVACLAGGETGYCGFDFHCPND